MKVTTKTTVDPSPENKEVEVHVHAVRRWDAEGVPLERATITLDLGAVVLHANGDDAAWLANRLLEAVVEAVRQDELAVSLGLSHARAAAAREGR